jgi:glutaredoxin
VLSRIRAKLKGILEAPSAPAPKPSAPAPVVAREPAPVMVYFEKDRNQRLIERVQQLLEAKQIAFRALDVSGDAATLAFIVREARCEEDDLPIVFIAGRAVGGYTELVDWDVSGKLRLAVFGR